MKKLGQSWLWTIFTVHIIGLSKDLLPVFIKIINEKLNQEYHFLDYMAGGLVLFVGICVAFSILLGVFNIVYCMLQALGVITVSNKPKIKQMSMYINKDGYIDKSYFITIDEEKIPVKVYQSPEQKIEVQANE